MINHARTLILNESYENRPAIDVYGEEYISETFIPIKLPNAEQAIRDIFLGTAGDPFYQNFILAKLMGIIHANEVSLEYTTGLDSRFTYNLDKSGVLSQDFGAIVTPINTVGMKLQTVGIGEADDASGISSFSWKISTKGADKVDIFDYWTGKTRTVVVTFSNGQTDPITLSNGMQFIITGQTWVPSELWSVYALSKPIKSLGKALNLFDGDYSNDVTKILSKAPKSFRTLWLGGYSLVDRLAGILGGLVYNLEDLYEY